MRVQVNRTQRRKRPAKSLAPPYRVPCGYCFSRWATGFDHLIPWIAGGTEETSNLYPSCRRCNSILGSQMFDSIEQKREHVRTRLIEKGKWYTDDSVPLLQEIIPSEPTPIVLHAEMSMGRVDIKESRIRDGQARSAQAPRQWKPGITMRCKICRIVFECPENPRKICEPRCTEREWLRRHFENLRCRLKLSRLGAVASPEFRTCINRWTELASELPMLDDKTEVWAFSSWPDVCDLCGLRAYQHPRFAYLPSLSIAAKMCSGRHYFLCI